MNNEEKILSILETLVTKVDKIEQGQAAMQADIEIVKEDVDTIKEDIEVIKEDTDILKEDSAITRESTEMLLEWATVINHVALEEVRKQRVARASIE